MLSSSGVSAVSAAATIVALDTEGLSIFPLLSILEIAAMVSPD